MPDQLKPLREYAKGISANLARHDSTEHTHRPALKTLVETLFQGAIATNEPQRTKAGAPDYIISSGQVNIGYIEAKDVGKNLREIEKDEQLKRYRASLPNLILTDYVEFRWYTDGEFRAAATLGSVADDSVKISKEGMQQVGDLLRSFMQHRVPSVGSPKELACRMAHLARMIRDIAMKVFEQEEEAGSLHGQYESFKQVLLPALEPAQFADMFAQTVAYGLFAARIHSPRPFTRQNAVYALPKTNPFLQKLFGHMAGVELDDRVAWIVDDLAQVLNDAEMADILQDFGSRTRKEDPVVHFYETFLQEYNPKERELRGVYYTPEPVVSYIVRSVDYLLRTKFDKPLGLADPNVLILDPACGTGTFLFYVVKLIHERLVEQGQAGGWNDYVEKHLLPRLFGFELLMAPYAIAHLKLGMQLEAYGYKFQSDQRLGVYLTNTLEEAVKAEQALGFAGFITDEANAAADIKREKPIMVVIGNPPYSGHSANPVLQTIQVAEETRKVGRGRKEREITVRYDVPKLRVVKNWIGRLIADYYSCDGRPLGEKNPKWLQDDYVKFIRFGQWRIERTGYGILGFVTNHGYLDNPTFRGMRRSLMQGFSGISVLNLHGNSKKKEVCPDGTKDENVFDIQQGVAIGLFVKEKDKHGVAEVQHSDLWGVREAKYARLNASDVHSTIWSTARPQSPFYLLVPRNVELLAEYEQGWAVRDAVPINVLGFQTHRDGFAVDFEKERIQERIACMRSEKIGDEVVRSQYGVKDNRDWKLAVVRARLRSNADWEEDIRKCLYRPFDSRWCYFSEVAMDYPRRELIDHVAGKGNLCLLVPRQINSMGWTHVFSASRVAESCVISTQTREQNYVFPLYLYPAPEEEKQQKDLLEGVQAWPLSEKGRRPNLSPEFVADVKNRLGMDFVTDGRGDLEHTFGPEDVFDYIYAVFHSPTYRTRYAEFLKIDFPRVPLTSDKALFRALVGKGAELVALHMMESPALNALITAYPVSGTDSVEKVEYNDQLRRVYVNKVQYFEGVEPDVWEFHIGGYQVLEKWLKDRKGRKLTWEDQRHYQKIVVALKETMRLMQEIDAVIPGWPIA